MRVRSHELTTHLSKALAPIYLLSGDEPLQLREAADCIRARAKQQGYTGRDILEVDARFDWSQLMAEANSLSLFAEQRIIDLRMASSKPGIEGARALGEYANRPPVDTLLLITMPKLDRSQTSSKWFKHLDQAGVVVQIWPVEGARLLPWLEHRMRNLGLTPAPEVIPMLAERIEGNLLAAAQEIDKLLLLHGPGVISPEQLASSVADSSRFDVYGLVDSALAGQAARCVRVLDGLRGEGTAAPVVLWALSREIRLLASLSREVESGRSSQQAMAGRRDLWEKRKPLVSKGLGRMGTHGWQQLLQLCGRTDRAIKGQDPSDPWLLLQDIVTRMAGVPAIGHQAST